MTTLSDTEWPELTEFQNLTWESPDLCWTEDKDQVPVHSDNTSLQVIVPTISDTQCGNELTGKRERTEWLDQSEYSFSESKLSSEFESPFSPKKTKESSSSFFDSRMQFDSKIPTDSFQTLSQTPDSFFGLTLSTDILSPADLDPDSIFSPTSICSSTFSSFSQPLSPLSSPQSEWSLQEVERIMKSSIDPIGKFLREMDVTPSQALELGLMDFLQQAPRKPREKYGPRKDLSPEERSMKSKERNREHAKATRLRKRVFKEASELLRTMDQRDRPQRSSQSYPSPPGSVDAFSSQQDSNFRSGLHSPSHHHAFPGPESHISSFPSMSPMTQHRGPLQYSNSSQMRPSEPSYQYPPQQFPVHPSYHYPPFHSHSVNQHPYPSPHTPSLPTLSSLYSSFNSLHSMNPHRSPHSYSCMPRFPPPFPPQRYLPSQHYPPYPVTPSPSKSCYVPSNPHPSSSPPNPATTNQLTMI